MRKNIIFCGGGSGGHILPALTLIKELENGFPSCTILCIGGHDGIEARLFSKYNFRGVSTGKLRRYFSIQNLFDFFKVIMGIIQSYRILFPYQSSETIIISTGGFVTIPVVIAGWLQRKPIVLHEQTTRAGLANRIAAKFSHKCLLTFEESLKFFPKGKSIWTGYPLRNEIFSSKDTKALRKLGITEGPLPVLFLTGGGNGSKLLNESLREALPTLSKEFFIIHQCGEGFLSEYKELESETYKVFDFVGEEMISLMKESQVVISRAGAGTVCELLALGKPSILIPLKIAQKNEQYHNAVVAQNQLGSIVIEETDLNTESLLSSIKEIQNISIKPQAKSNPVYKILEEVGEV